MRVIEPVDEDKRFALGGEDVANYVRKFLVGPEDGDMGAECGVRGVAPAEQNRLKFAVG